MTEFNRSHIDGIVLAAGFSSRAGAFKMEMVVNGKPMLHRVLDGMCRFCGRVLVVAGFRMDRILSLTKNFPTVTVVENKNYEDGMFSSVKTGVREINAPWFFFTPGDYPIISNAVYRALLEAAAKGAPDTGNVFIPVFNGRKGHPILVNGGLKEELLNEPADSNLKVFINRNGFTPVPVQEKSILLDIDTPEDYKRILEIST